jgi:hypothetical protein
MAVLVNKLSKLINIKGEINMKKKLVAEVEALKAGK